LPEFVTNIDGIEIQFAHVRFREAIKHAAQSTG